MAQIHRHVMIDLETLGTVPGCKILSIGAVLFDASGVGRQFYATVDRAGQGAHHNALYDAISQAQHAAGILMYLSAVTTGEDPLIFNW